MLDTERTIEDILKDIPIEGIIHVGANTGQEVPFYASLDVPVLFFEPLEEPFAILKKKIIPYSSRMIAAKLALGPEDTTIEIFESSKDGVSSSILTPEDHLKVFPNRTFKPVKVQQMRLDTYYDNWMSEEQKFFYNVMVMDIQGYEYPALCGAQDTLGKLQYILLEVWYKPLYKDTVLKEDMDKALEVFGYKERECVPVNEYFGNCLYAKE